jgi:endoglucanase
MTMIKKSFTLAFLFFLLILFVLYMYLNYKSIFTEKEIEKEIFLYKVSGANVLNPEGQNVKLQGLALPNGVYNIEYPYQLFDSDYELFDSDYERIASMGLNSVRFYIQYYWLDDENYYDFFKYLDKQLALGEKHGINFIINLHFFGMADKVQKGLEDGFYKGNHKYDIVSFWKKISDRYKKEDRIVAYDLINEPYISDAFSEKQLYKTYKDLIKLIRDNDDEHIIIVSDPVNNFPKALKEGRLRKRAPFVKLQDNNLMYQFHWYEPIEFTHQGFFETDYFELGAQYPSVKTIDQYKGGFYRSPYISDTDGKWFEYKTKWVDLNLVNTPVDIIKDKFNLSLSYTHLEGKVWFDDIRLYKKDSEGNIVQVSVPNHDIRDSRSFVGWVENPLASDVPSRWNAMNDPDTSGIITGIDWYNDYSGNGSGSLFVDASNAIWGKNNPWAVWGQSGGAVSTYYNIDLDSTYQVKFAVKTTANSKHAISVGFGVYEVKEILINKITMRNMLREYYSFWARKMNVPLYCGEFGTTNPGMLDSSFYSPEQAQWLEDFISILNEEVGHWTYHSYKSNSPRSDLFGLYNNNVDNELINVISKNSILNLNIINI